MSHEVCSKSIPKAGAERGHEWDDRGLCTSCGWRPPQRCMMFAERFVELRDPDGVEPHPPSVWMLDRWIDSVGLSPKELHRHLVLDVATMLWSHERESS